MYRNVKVKDRIRQNPMHHHKIMSRAMNISKDSMYSIKNQKDLYCHQSTTMGSTSSIIVEKTESKHAARYNEFYSDLWPLGEHINYRATNTSYPRWYPAYVCARCTETHTESSNYSKDTNTWVVVALVILICFGAHRPTEPYVSSTPVAYGGCGTWIVIILQIMKAEVHDGHSVYNSSQLAYTD